MKFYVLKYTIQKYFLFGFFTAIFWRKFENKVILSRIIEKYLLFSLILLTKFRNYKECSFYLQIKNLFKKRPNKKYKYRKLEKNKKF